jgi:hypothetical protein
MSSFMGSRKKDAPKNKNHAQDCRTLIEAGDQRPAILPWFSNFGWRPSFRVIRAPCPLRPAAGLLLDWSVGMNANGRTAAFENHAPGASRHRPAHELRVSLDQKPLNKRFRSKLRAKNARRRRAQNS